MLWEEKLSCFWLLRLVLQIVGGERRRDLIRENETTENIKKCYNQIPKVSVADYGNLFSIVLRLFIVAKQMKHLELTMTYEYHLILPKFEKK